MNGPLFNGKDTIQYVRYKIVLCRLINKIDIITSDRKERTIFVYNSFQVIFLGQTPFDIGQNRKFL